MQKLNKKTVFGAAAAVVCVAVALIFLLRPKHVEEILPIVGVDTVRTRNVEVYGEFPGKIRAQGGARPCQNQAAVRAEGGKPTCFVREKRFRRYQECLQRHLVPPKTFIRYQIDILKESKKINHVAGKARRGWSLWRHGRP